MSVLLLICLKANISYHKGIYIMNSTNENTNVSTAAPHFHIGMRNIKTAIAATLTALIYLFLTAILPLHVSVRYLVPAAI